MKALVFQGNINICNFDLVSNILGIDLHNSLLQSSRILHISFNLDSATKLSVTVEVLKSADTVIFINYICFIFYVIW